MRFIRVDGSFDHQAIDTAFRARLRHYQIFDERVPGVMTLIAWKNAVTDALEAEILAEKRKWQSEQDLITALKGMRRR